MSSRMYDDLNYKSSMFPNQCVSGHDPALYPPVEKDNPRRYHEKLKESDKRHLYPDLFKDEDEVDAAKESRTVVPVQQDDTPEDEEEE